MTFTADLLAKYDKLEIALKLLERQMKISNQSLNNIALALALPSNDGGSGGLVTVPTFKMGFDVSVDFPNFGVLLKKNGAYFEFFRLYDFFSISDGYFNNATHTTLGREVIYLNTEPRVATIDLPIGDYYFYYYLFDNSGIGSTPKPFNSFNFSLGSGEATITQVNLNVPAPEGNFNVDAQGLLINITTVGGFEVILT